MRRLLPGLSAASLTLGLVSVPLHAQAPPASPESRVPPADSLAARADSLLLTGDVRAALALLDEALETEGPVVELSWRAARAAVNHGMRQEPDSEDRAREWYRRAETYADARIEADSSDARAWEWLAIARGRRSLTEGMRTRATLVNGIRDASARALALDSARAGAHHVLGMWHAEIRRLNTFERLGAGALGADDFDEATWDEAVHHLETATRLAPEGLVHGLELARTYTDVDRPEDAVVELRRILALEIREPGEEIVRREAVELLGRLREGGEAPLSDSEDASPRR